MTENELRKLATEYRQRAETGGGAASSNSLASKLGDMMVKKNVKVDQVVREWDANGDVRTQHSNSRPCFWPLAKTEFSRPIPCCTGDISKNEFRINVRKFGIQTSTMSKRSMRCTMCLTSTATAQSTSVSFGQA